MIINENQLDEWARSNALNAQGLIVELVWLLAAASCPKPRERRFPLSDSIGQHGPDGVLEVNLPFEPFIPDGRSFWEIGTGLDAGDKATRAYRDLTDAVPEATRKSTTFVFVTPRSGRREWEYTWKEQAQAAWLDERRRKKEWQDVRTIDGTKLVDWLDHFPAVGFWLASKIGNVPLGQIDIPSQHWTVLSSIGQPPPLAPELFLANREEATARLKEVFDETSMQLKLTTHYPDQVVDFVTAYLASLDEESKADAVGRCLIVSGVDGWNAVCNTTHWKRQVLIADAALDLSGDAGTKLIQKARRAGHAIVFGGPYGGIPDPASSALPTPLSHHIQEALKKAGYQEERARALAQKSDGNLSSLLRCIQNLSVLPAWAEGSDAAQLAIAVLLGSWSDGSQADQAAVENVSGKAYGEWIRGLREIAVSPATPLIQRDGRWKFVSRYDGWYALGSRVFDEHLERLKHTAASVLREVDPRFELPPDQRFAASMHGKVLQHSRLLRNGLAEALALLGSHPTALISCSLGKAELTANLTVREILDGAGWVQWASLNDLLPLLAEAAPGEFLKAVEATLQSVPCPFDEIFAQEGNGIFGDNYLTGVLWALETLAWDADYLSRVVTCLGELAEHDPGGRGGNRPANSLATIFLPWFPQTCAPINKRIAAVKTLLKELPDVGWKLLVSLLPKQHAVSSGTRRPAWRTTIPDDWRDGSLMEQYWEQVAAYAALAIEHGKKDPARLNQLIENLEHLPPSAHEELLDYLKSDSIRALATEDQLSVWNKLVDLVSKHRRFASAKWAMRPEQVDEISAIADRLSPEAPFFLNQRLFSDRDHDLFEEKGDYQLQIQELEKRRQAAIEEVAKAGGTQTVIDFAKIVQSPWRVGISFGFVANLDADTILLPALFESEIEPLGQFVGGFVWGRFRSRGWEWVDSHQPSVWTPAQIGKFLSFLPFTPDTWERATVLLGANQSDFWTRTPANPYEAATGLEFAVDQLIKYGRPLAAIRCLHKILYDKQPLNGKQAIQALLEALGSADRPNAMDTYEVAEIITALQNDRAVDPDELSKLEWAYLPLLEGDRGATPKLLWRRLAQDPAFFCEVIRIAFRSKKADRLETAITEERKNIATNAFRLLHEWRRPPGSEDDGSYNADALRNWLDAIKKECAESGHMEIAMTMVGHVLIYVPPDPGGLWIHRSAAEVLNAKDAQDMRNGFHTELFNSRGVHWINPTGKPEQELAVKYRQQAEDVEAAGYQRLGGSLRDLADSYERDAQRISSRDLLDDW